MAVRCLLDTSTLLWAVGQPEQLTPAARRSLSRGPLVLSVVSYWEVVIKAAKGTLEIADPVNWWSRVTTQIGGEILSVRAAHISALAALPPIHADPFDRLLVAQAAAEGLAIVTRDALIARYPVKVIW